MFDDDCIVFVDGLGYCGQGGAGGGKADVKCMRGGSVGALFMGYFLWEAG